jgi:hypothetical protein
VARSSISSDASDGNGAIPVRAITVISVRLIAVPPALRIFAATDALVGRARNAVVKTPGFLSLEAAERIKNDALGVASLSFGRCL